MLSVVDLVTFMFFECVNQVMTFLYDFLFTHLLSHAKVSQVSQGKAPHLFPGVTIGQDYA